LVLDIDLTGIVAGAVDRDGEAERPVSEPPRTSPLQHALQHARLRVRRPVLAVPWANM